MDLMYCKCNSNLYSQNVSKIITVFLNGSPEISCKICITSKSHRKWHRILSEITNHIKPNFGKVRKLYTSESGISLNSFTDLKDNETYVASDHKNYKVISGGYRHNKKCCCSIEHYSPGILEKYNRKTKLSYVRRDLIVIYIFENGKYRKWPIKFVLTNKDLEYWENTLNYIAEALDLEQVHLKYLYTLHGNIIIDPLELQHGGTYVAVPQDEKFIKHPEYVISWRHCLENKKVKKCIKSTYKIYRIGTIYKHRKQFDHQFNLKWVHFHKSLCKVDSSMQRKYSLNQVKWNERFTTFSICDCNESLCTLIPKRKQMKNKKTGVLTISTSSSSNCKCTSQILKPKLKLVPCESITIKNKKEEAIVQTRSKLLCTDSNCSNSDSINSHETICGKLYDNKPEKYHRCDASYFSSTSQDIIQTYFSLNQINNNVIRTIYRKTSDRKCVYDKSFYNKSINSIFDMLSNTPSDSSKKSEKLTAENEKSFCYDKPNFNDSKKSLKALTNNSKTKCVNKISNDYKQDSKTDRNNSNNSQQKSSDFTNSERKYKIWCNDIKSSNTKSTFTASNSANFKMENINSLESNSTIYNVLKKKNCKVIYQQPETNIIYEVYIDEEIEKQK